MARKRWDLTFPPRSATKPITYHLVKDFDLSFNRWCIQQNLIRQDGPTDRPAELVCEIRGALHKPFKGAPRQPLVEFGLLE